MATLRKMVDTLSPAAPTPQAPLKEGDQVIVRKAMGNRGPRTTEVMVGQISAMNNNIAEVTLPRPGGVIMRAKVPVGQLQPVSDVFKRTKVPFNPAFRKTF